MRQAGKAYEYSLVFNMPCLLIESPNFNLHSLQEFDFLVILGGRLTPDWH